MQYINVKERFGLHFLHEGIKCHILIYLYLFFFQVGSEDALSSVDDSNINEQLSTKAHTLEQVSILNYTQNYYYIHVNIHINLILFLFMFFSFVKENEKLLMEYEILKMENESLKLDLSKYVAASQKRRGDTLDSGDFNTFSETSVGESINI